MDKTNLVLVAALSFLSYGCLEGVGTYDAPDALETDTMPRPLKPITPFATSPTYSSGVDIGTPPRVDPGPGVDAQGFIPGTGCAAQRLNHRLGVLTDFALHLESTDWLNWDAVSLAAFGCTGVGTKLLAGAVGGTILSLVGIADNNPTAHSVMVVTTDDGKILYSPDGRFFSLAYTGSAGQFTAGEFSQHVFWSSRKQRFYVGSAFGVAASKALVVSYDGITWGEVADPSSLTTGVTCFAESATRIVAGRDGGNILTSDNGITWTARVNPAADKSLRVLAYNGTMFVGISNDGTKITSADGITWVDRGNVNGTSPVADHGLVWDAARSLWIHTSGVSSVTDSSIETSSDGITWTLAPQGVDENNYVVAISNTVMDGGTIYGVNATWAIGNRRLHRSVDGGATWTTQRMSAGFDGPSIFKGYGRLVTLGQVNSLPGLLLGTRTGTTYP